MRLALLLSTLCVPLLLSCSDTTGTDVGDLRVKAFYKNQVTLTVEPNRVVVDSSTTITARCLPLVTGKGKIGLSGYGSLITSTWQIDDPIQHFFNRANRDTMAAIDIEFSANQPCTQQWTVRLHNQTDYYFLSTVQIDSVFIADSGRMYSIHSDVAQRQTNGNGYNFIASGDYTTIHP